ncbi:MAG: alpha-hydroxy-acid oxidizing protein, partial [Stackebrandtia sp.]
MERLRADAERILPPPVAEYFRQGATEGTSAAEAVDAWNRWRLRPKVLRDVTSVSTEVTALGRRFETPVLVAPTTLQRRAHPDGELATARGVSRAGSLLSVST